MTTLNEQEIEAWRNYIPRMHADAVWLAGRMRTMAERPPVAAEIRTYLAGFIEGTLPIEELRAAFDTKGRAQWASYGLGGMSFAMFLNMLVKYIPDRAELTTEVRKAVPAPEANIGAAEQARHFLAYLEGLIQKGTVRRQQLQPARTPMFLSTWWYFQTPDRWPIYYLSARQAFQLKGLVVPSGDVVRDYIGFRDRYVELGRGLGLDFESLETLALWVAEQEGKDESPPPLATPLPPPQAAPKQPTLIAAEVEEPAAEPGAGRMHTHIQWLLAKLGTHFGCKVWIASNDRGKVWQGEVLGNLAVEQLPNLGMGPEANTIVSLIDVVWFRPNGQVVAAFEVETTTSVYSGILRMSDLSVTVPNLVFPIYIVAPAERAEKVARELRRPTFQSLELHKRCGFIRCEELIQNADNIRKFAADPSAINRLATYVGDI